jgi:hypothetical protein
MSDQDDLQDQQGGTYNTPQDEPKRDRANKDRKPSERLVKEMPEGMERSRKGPVGPRTGRR